MAPNVQCYVEDTLLPGVTKQLIRNVLNRRLEIPSDSYFSGRELAGWYYQQVCYMFRTKLSSPSLGEKASYQL